MNHFPGATYFDRQTFTDILEENELFVQQYNNEINVTKDEYSKKKITEKYNNDWNNKLIKELQINPINIINDDYTKFYDSNGIVLIPSHTQYINHKMKTVYITKYSGMKQTNWNFISLLRNQTNQKLVNETEYDGEYDPSLDKGKKYYPNKNYYKHKDSHNSIEAYTGKQSNLISVDIDYAFLCCKLFIELYKTSSLCTLTKNGFHFHY